MRQSGSGQGTTSEKREEYRALVELECRTHGVPAPIALAIVDLESSFNADARGDTSWATKKPALYERLVYYNDYFANNPVREEPSEWYSRGLFQLLAAYHTRAEEHPDVLFDPHVNVRRGVLFIRKLLEKTRGDPLEARLYYTGAIGGSQQLKDETRAKMAAALERWGWRGKTS
jgi:soluble lytic murein transglycosylase-like protein